MAIEGNEKNSFDIILKGKQQLHCNWSYNLEDESLLTDQNMLTEAQVTSEYSMVNLVLLQFMHLHACSLITHFAH